MPASARRRARCCRRSRDWLAGPACQHSRLILAGHSLGAALATLAATVFPPALLVTLGSPRVGDAEFVAALAEVARRSGWSTAATW